MPMVSQTRFLALAACLLLGGALAHAQSAPVPPRTTDQAFKNIQVLKNLPEEQLIPAMQFVSASLGVGCDFCHVQGKFDQDDKKTKVAKHDCKGKNECKGQGGCKAGAAGCKGKNDCKGQGGCSTMDKKKK